MKKSRNLDDITGIDAFACSVRQGVSADYDAFKPPFKAVVIKEPFRLPAGNIFSDVPVVRNIFAFFGGGKQPQAFYGRLQGDPSLHDWLDDPCDPAFTGTPVQTMALISNHTLFTDTEENPADDLKIGDVVEVNLTKNYDGTYDIRGGEYVRKITPTRGQKPAPKCANIAELDFAETSPVTYGNNEYPALFHRYPKSFSALDASVLSDFEAFFAALEAANYKPVITSVRRSVKHQWCLHFPGRCFDPDISTPYNPVVKTPDPPCNSKHQYGFAIDMNATSPSGQGINSKSIDALWAPIVKIAKKHNLIWAGAPDRVHFSHKTGKSAIVKLKQKCRGFFYDTYGSDFKSWPSSFDDELSYTSGETPTSSETDISSMTEEERMGESGISPELDQVSETDITDTDMEELYASYSE